jgi:hypothetical protein
MAKASSKRGSNKPAARVVARTETRNTAIPRITTAGKDASGSAQSFSSSASSSQLSHEQIARRAYEIWSSGTGGSEFDNWIRAERELRGR